MVRIAVVITLAAFFSAEEHLGIVSGCSTAENIFVQNSSQGWLVKDIVLLIKGK